MGIWEYMKTTVELPEALFRRAKSMAVQEGVTLKQLLTEALESRLDTRRGARNGKAAAPRWMRAYGALQHLRHERKAIERAQAIDHTTDNGAALWRTDASILAWLEAL